MSTEATDLHAVFATGADGATVRVSDPLPWAQAQREWGKLEELRTAGRLPQAKFFEVRSVQLGPDRPLVGPEVRSHDRYDQAPVDLTFTQPVVGRGFKRVEDAARRAWKLYTGGRFHVRAGVGRERESDPAGEATGVQGRGGWFYWPNGVTAAQGLTGLARLCRQRRLVLQGVDGRWYPVDTAPKDVVAA